MSFDAGLTEWAMEALEPLGTVTLRKMMGVATLYLNGVIFAVVDDSAIWFKGDKDSEAEWDAAGCERFTFTGKDGKVETMNYRRAPDEVYDDAEAMQRWAGLALQAGLRGAAKKRKR